MRSSCEASATNWRRRSSEADFSSKAPSIWASISFRAEPRRPISVPGPPLGDTAGQVPRGDGVGGARHLAQGAQAAAHDDQDQDAHGQQDGQAGDELHLAQRGEGVVGRVERERGDQRPLRDRHRHGAVLRRRGRRCCPGRLRRGRGGRCRRSARRGRGCRCRAPAAPGCPWSGWAPGRGGSATPRGGRRMTVPLRSSRTARRRPEETRRESSDSADRQTPRRRRTSGS